MKNRFSYDAKANILEIDFSHFTISQSNQIIEIANMIHSLCQPLQQKVYAVVNYEGFKVEDTLKENYAHTINELYNLYSLGTFRYSATAFFNWALQSLFNEQKLESYPFKSKQEALMAVQKLKDQKEN